eukprot:973350-Pleurochrysis_carterae.AAC.1
MGRYAMRPISLYVPQPLYPFLFSEYRHYRYAFRPPCTPDIGEGGANNLECNRRGGAVYPLTIMRLKVFRRYTGRGKP